MTISIRLASTMALMGAALGAPLDLETPPTQTAFTAVPGMMGDSAGVVFDVDRAGDPWVRGETYKASFTPLGLTYIPFLGSDAPRNFPVTMRLTGATAGGKALELEPKPRVSRNGDRFTIDHGSVEVIYDVSPRGVEQSFLFEPGLRGEVRIQVATTSEFNPELRGDETVWGNEYGGVQYGAATAFGSGRRACAVERELRGSVIELSVPASFVDATNGPLLVDPLITTFNGITPVSGAYLGEPKLAYDRLHDRYMAVCVERFSMSDRDVVRVFLDAYSGASSARGYVDMTSLDVTSPAVAHLRSPGTYLVAVVSPTGPSGKNEVVGRRVSLAGFSPNSMPSLVSPGPGDDGVSRPRMGGDNGASGTNHCGLIATVRRGWRDTLVFARVQFNASVVPGSARNLSYRSAANLRDVAISPSTGDPGSVRAWVVGVLETNASQSVHVDVLSIRHTGSTAFSWRRIVDVPGGIYLSDLEISDLSGLRSPSTNLPYYLVSYLQQRTPALVLCSGNLVHTQELLGDLAHFERGGSTDLHAQATIRGGWLVAHQASSLDGGLGFDLVSTALSPVNDRLAVLERGVRFDTGTLEGLSGASAYSGGALGYRDAQFLYVMGGSAGAEVEGAVVTLPFETAAGGQYCYGTPNSTGERSLLQVFGTNLTFGPKKLRATGLPPLQRALFLAGQTSAFLPGGWGGLGVLCVNQSRVVPDSFGRADSSGVHEFSANPLALPSSSGIVSAIGGQSWHFQCWHLGGTEHNFTNGVTIRFQ